MVATCVDTMPDRELYSRRKEMTPVSINKVFVNQAQPERIQYVMVDRDSGAQRRLWVGCSE
jgi:hypothetical protein